MKYKLESEDVEYLIRQSLQVEGVNDKNFSINKSVEDSNFHSIVLVLVDNKSRESLVLPLADYIGESDRELLEEELELILKFNKILYSELSSLME